MWFTFCVFLVSRHCKYWYCCTVKAWERVCLGRTLDVVFADNAARVCRSWRWNFSREGDGSNVTRWLEAASELSCTFQRESCSSVFRQVCHHSVLSFAAMYSTVYSTFSALMLLVGRQEGHPACKKAEWWCAGVVICLDRGADLHMAQLMPLPLTVSCYSKIQIGFTFLVPAHLGSPRKGPLNGCACARARARARACVRVCVRACVYSTVWMCCCWCTSRCDSVLLRLRPFNGLFSRTTWVNQYQKGKTSLNLIEARDDGVMGCSGIGWSICKQSAPRSRQITTPTPHRVLQYKLRFYAIMIINVCDKLVSWHSGRTSVSDWWTFPVLRSTCSWWVTTNVGKPSATGQPTRTTQPFILSGSINE